MTFYIIWVAAHVFSTDDGYQDQGY